MRKSGQKTDQDIPSFVVEKLKVKVYPDRRGMEKPQEKLLRQR